MNELQIFNNPEFGQVRGINLNGEPWLIGKDITDRLEYQNGSRDINRHVDEEDRKIVPIFDGTQNRETIIINESGLYSLILGSHLPKAKEFKRWVTSEVLPSIRKTGGYVSDEDMFINTYLPYADEKTKVMFRATLAVVKGQNEQIAEMKPKAEFFDTVAGSRDAIAIGDAAKVLNMGIGRNRLFQILRDNKVLMKDNIPYQEFIDRGYFRTIEQKWTTPEGETKINIKTLVYQKGLNYIRKILKEVVS